jgi:hypothetical protein
MAGLALVTDAFSTSGDEYREVPSIKRLGNESP